MDDIEQAIKRSQEAVKCTPNDHDHPYIAGILNNLAGKLAVRYDREGKINDLKQAIEGTRICRSLRLLTELVTPQRLKENRLTVGDLRDQRLQENSPFLAYLSACSTGSNKAEALHDEGIILISAYQPAGFRHVVGTLWEVKDEHCVDVVGWNRLLGLVLGAID